ncbi:hypothetical protein ACJX0J_009454, partial [Zea mays]
SVGIFYDLVIEENGYMHLFVFLIYPSYMYRLIAEEWDVTSWNCCRTTGEVHIHEYMIDWLLIQIGEFSEANGQWGEDAVETE